MLNNLEGGIDVAKQSEQSDQTPLWREGFDEGVRIVQAKLNHTKHKKGVAALERELLEPFDVSERRQ